MTQVSPIQLSELESLYRTNAIYQGALPFEYFLNLAQGQFVPLELNLDLSVAKLENDFDKREQNIRASEYQSENIRISEYQNSTPPKVKLNPSIHQEIVQEIINYAPFAFGNFEIPLSVFSSSFDQNLITTVDLNGLIDQIIQQVKLVKEHGKTELIIGLKPENLGELLLSIASRSGMISIQISASEDAKKILDDHLAELEAALKKANINLEELKVEVINYDIPTYSAS